MLTELMQLLEQNRGELDLNKIGRELRAQPSAVAGMVEVLVRKGRLVEVTPLCGICNSCDLKNQCVLPAKGVKRYAVVERRPLFVPES